MGYADSAKKKKCACVQHLYFFNHIIVLCAPRGETRVRHSTNEVQSSVAVVDVGATRLLPINFGLIQTTIWHPPSRSMVRSDHDVRTNIIRELVETEGKYVRDLELMQVWMRSWCFPLAEGALSSSQKYAVAVSDSGLLPRHTIHLLFSNLTELLAFQRKFLLRLEATENLPWQEQQR